MNPATLEGLLAFAPEIVLALAAFSVLAAELLGLDRGSERIAGIAMAALGVVAVLLMTRSPLHAGTVLGSVERDGFGAFFKLLTSAGSAVVVLLWNFDRRKQEAGRAGACFFLLTALLGAFLIVGTNHALVLMLGLELLSLSTFAFVALEAKRPAAMKAVLRFLFRSGFASAVTLFGLSLLYGLTGTLDFTRMTTGEAPLPQLFASSPWPVALALGFVFAGILAKVSLAPLGVFELYVVDVTPSAVSAFLVLMSKTACFGGLLRLLCALFVQDGVAPAMARCAADLSGALAIFAAATMTLASFAALQQLNLRRLLVCASAAQSGMALIGLAALNETSFSAAVTYLAISALATAAGLLAAAHFESCFGSGRVEDLRGLGWKSPLAALAMIASLASWIGLPPTAGFYGVLRLLLEGWNAGLGWLAVVLVINTWIAAFVVLRIAALLFQDAPLAAAPGRERVLVSLAVALSIALLLLGLWTRPLETWANSCLDLLRAVR